MLLGELYHHPLHGVWCAMKARCYRQSSARFRHYGGRGIIVYAEWHTFMPFYKWAIANGWKKGLQIDRRNNDGNYEPDNCQFITHIANGRNKQNSRFTAEDVAEIKAFFARGVSPYELTRAYDASSYRYIHKIVRGDLWADIPPADYLCIPC